MTRILYGIRPGRSGAITIWDQYSGEIKKLDFIPDDVPELVDQMNAIAFCRYNYAIYGTWKEF